jgi:hypothetical protein
MRRTTTALLTVLLAAGAAGCSDGSEEPADAKPSPSVSASLSAEDQFLQAAKALKFTGTQPGNAELTALPPQWCTELDAGHSVEYLFDDGQGGLYPYGSGWGMEKKDAYELLVAGVKAYCPANAAAVVEELKAAGEY